MLLHIVHDDKIIPRMISQFEEVCPGNSVYLCLKRLCDSDNLSFLKGNSKVIWSDSADVQSIPWHKIDKICIHYLNLSKLKYYWKLRIKYNLHKCKVIWFIWSGDVYDILERRGFNLYSNDNSYLKIRDKNDHTLISSLNNLSNKSRRIISDLALRHFMDKRVDYLVCNSQDEYNLFSRYISFSRCKELLKYTYYPLEDTLGTLIDKKIYGDSIIIGNSASESNNHEYILSFIDKLDFGDRKIYVPLSYGRDLEYINIIEEKYRRLPNVVIMRDFLPLDDYNKLLTSCNFFVYGNYRSEGWGNILVALYLGGKVYVSEKSFLSLYLEKEGYKFFKTEKITETFNIELTEEEVFRNRQIAMQSCSREQNKINIEYICSL